jgi:hypothetical protein
MSDTWITLSNLFDNLSGYLKHHYGCGTHYGIACDCGLLQYQGQMEEIIQRFVKAAVIARTF